MKRRAPSRCIAAIVALALVIGGWTDRVAAAPFTPGHLVVVRIGDGAGALSNAATAVFLDEYTNTGSLVQTIALPTAVSGSNQRLTNSGTAASEGFLTLSGDEQYLLHTGYDAAVGTASVVSTTSAANNRVVSRVDLNGNIDTSTALTDAYSGNNIRSATSTNGIDIWTGGTAPNPNGSVRCTTLGGTTSTQCSTTITNIRVLNVYGGQLYCSSATGSFQGVSTVGSGAVCGSGQTITLLPGFPTVGGPSNHDYVFTDANTLYVADDRTTTAGGLQKWTFDGSTWSLAYTLTVTSISPFVGLRGVALDNRGAAPVFYATSTDNRILTVTDTGASSTFSTVATGATNTAIRGIRRILGVVCTPLTLFADPDGDGIGTTGDTIVACAPQAGYVTVGDDNCPTLANPDQADTDNDGVGDACDGCPMDPLKIDPGLCGCGVADTDTDGDLTPDCLDGCPDDPLKTDPGQCGCGFTDTDSDGDLTADCVDGCPMDPLKIEPGLCGCGVTDIDTDDDLTPDCLDGCPDDPLKTDPGQCGCGNPDTDTDGDLTADCVDGCPMDPLKIEPGLCGCGVADTDTDGDLTPDCLDGCPDDPLKTDPGQCGCGNPDTDTDGDLTADCVDGCPLDPLKIEPGLCGCGVADTDTDGDLTPDCDDGCPDDPLKTAPGQCGCGFADTDTDGDLTADCVDGCPMDPLKIEPGLCGCGVADTDTDGDLTPDCLDGCPDDPLKTDPGQCGCGNPDTDTDGDLTADCVDNCPTVRNADQADADNDRIGDACEAPVDIVEANPPSENPFVAGQQPFRDVLQTGTTPVVTQGIGALGTPSQDTVIYGTISVTFSDVPTPLPTALNVGVACTDVTGDGPGDCPTVLAAVGVGVGPHVLTLSGVIPPRECTTLTFGGTNAGQQLQYQYLPGDVNMSGMTSATDLSALVLAINTGAPPPASLTANLPRYDINRLGTVSATDVARLVGLLNGVNTTQPWTSVSVAACP